METTDHALLANLLIAKTGMNISPFAKWLFRFGCIEPDINKFSYLRGSLKNRMVRGHNAEITEAHIKAKLSKIRAGRHCSLFDWFTLGTTIHYIADSFTFAHNGRTFGKSLRKHIEYEKALSREFREKMGNGIFQNPMHCPEDPLVLFSRLRLLYENETPSLENDCTYIVRSSLAVMDSLIPYPA